MILSEAISFMRAALESTDKERTYYELVSDIEMLSRACEQGSFQLFWVVDRKGTLLTSSGRHAAGWASNSARFEAAYVISGSDGDVTIRQV